MRFFSLSKDGGPKSRVWGYFLFEIKPLFSIALLHFKDGSREAYHSHAFNAVSWVLWGQLFEDLKGRDERGVFRPSLRPIVTRRGDMHRVVSRKNSWVLTFRGPWAKTWQEIDESGKSITLTHGREVV